MKKADAMKATLRPEYKSSDFLGGLTRGKYAKQAAASNIIVLEPEVAAAFPDSAAVNDALRALLKVAKRAAAGAR
ncbi:hypothetical protein [Thermomonas sp.]|uniref:hypothetical protein n=1 Tax=Thermomonas sp. TaxID=1971895 RepID=UPI002627CD58|nr:hypothetical protein [Thermomonas sp.]